MAFLFGQRNAAEVFDAASTGHAGRPPTNSEFMGMIEHIPESIHDLLMEGVYDSNSSTQSYHPSRECFMADTLDGLVETLL